MFRLFQKQKIPLFLLFFLNFQVFSKSLEPQTDIFFTQTKNCYKLELTDCEPQQVQIELPDLPPNTKFVSSQKEGFISENGKKGTRIFLWFSFLESGKTSFSPLLVKINGSPHYFEFEKVDIFENPALVSPVLEIQFFAPKNLKTQKDGTKILEVTKNEKIVFLVKARYAVEISNFSWKIPKDSIFTEIERFDFANGKQKSTQFTNEACPLSRFEWQILKEGTFSLPEISALATSFNGQQKEISLAKNTLIAVTNGKNQKNTHQKLNDDALFASAFEKNEKEVQTEKPLSREDLEKLAQRESRTFFQRLFNQKYALFTSGKIYSIPEKNAAFQTVAGGQKVKITEHAGEWAFLECEEFSGWTESENLVEIK